MDDDMYPAGGEYFLPREPVDQKKARKKEEAKILEKIEVLTDLIERLDQRIEFYGSVDSIPNEVKLDPTQFLNMHNANQMVRDSLRSEREYIQSLIDPHLR